MLRFTKMNGAGNDFVLIDNRLGDLRALEAQVAGTIIEHDEVVARAVHLRETQLAHAGL